MYNSAFSPFGFTYLVGTSPVQVVTNNNMYPSGYRIMNLTNAIVRVGWTPQLPLDKTATPTVTTPTATGTENVLSIPANGVGVFSGIPPNAWFIASAAASLEITPGEGIN
jgi:hypothetical protein